MIFCSPLYRQPIHYSKTMVSKSRARSFRARPLPKSTENRPGPPLRFCRFCHGSAVDISPGRCYTGTVFFGNALGGGLRRMPQRDNQTDTPRTAAERPERDWDFQPQNRSGGVFCLSGCQRRAYNGRFLQKLCAWKGKVNGMSTKFVFVTGGVVSGLGKGICAV